MADGEILVTFSSLAQAQTDTGSAFTAIQQELTDLRTYLNPLVSSWTGQAATNYQAAQTKWDNAVTDLNQVLGIISQALGTAHSTYRDTETINAGMWE
ncbi:WXG100 family type VII secretion target [Frankia sp. R82]|uniref:WXG100 family type VII secretion target n=1 Tax=Frankia sp. R82 TaxID=2950553 RepID=UPI002043EABE|nr:WXG100 family type VII secretion target [Frankia sp. R82]MCM3883409.1 WXG100 family type VII secretion target [Frankia sp. R82]